MNSGMLTLTDSAVSSNTGELGGGIYNDKGTVSLTNSTVSDNTIDFDGGGILNERGTLTLTNSTISRQY